MSLSDKIDDWKMYPNALGSESQVAVIVGEVSVVLEEEIPKHVKEALKTLSLRGTMRDIAKAIASNEEPEQHNMGVPSFHDVVDAAGASCCISWAEALSILTIYLEERRAKIG
ncbi:MAG: hypothetical protein A6F71_01670 [Cycloclasticus sp. symbiont of Poecilosclerida sp. M]|nr:MAG: hypothetical protein A6F71_01670 [Cycloclasticus sp. symbiont of Poecilosclerida sp. M]